MRVLELFSGIGGMHYALKSVQEMCPDFKFNLVQAIDISDVANQVYKHNFPEVDVKGRNICGITPKMLEKWQIDAIFMSPPCQPFTRQGNQKDLKDNRSQPFLHIMNELLPKASSLNYILLENVKGFEGSEAHKLLTETLQTCGFKYQEFLLCPKQLGIPNSRLRYYLIATKDDSFVQGADIITKVTEISCPDILEKFSNTPIKSLSNYKTDENDPFEIESLLLKDQTLGKHAEVFDIVQSDSKGSCCFTKAYGKYAEGTGSILQQSGNLKEAFQSAAKETDLEKRLEHLRELKLRYFSPYEVAKLMGFPADFKFPPEYIKKPHLCFRVLGNSLNVTVVSLLTALLINKKDIP